MPNHIVPPAPRTTPASRRDVAGIVGRAIDQQIERALGPIIEQITSKARTLVDDEDSGAARGAGGRFVGRDARELGTQLIELKKKVAAADAKLAAETKRSHSAKIEAELAGKLAKLGVGATLVRGVTAIHRDAMFVDEDGEVRYKSRRNGYEEDLTPAEALRDWAKTDEGQAFVAAGRGKPASRPMGNRSKDPGRDLSDGVAQLLNSGSSITIDSGFPVDGASAGGSQKTPEAIAEAKRSLMVAVGELLGGGGSVGLE